MAAHLTDSHVCPQVIGIIPHPGIVITAPEESTVLIGYMPAAVEGDICTCVGPPTSIKEGSGTVEIGGKAAARLLDPTDHDGFISSGGATGIIGD